MLRPQSLKTWKSPKWPDILFPEKHHQSREIYKRRRVGRGFSDCFTCHVRPSLTKANDVGGNSVEATRESPDGRTDGKSERRAHTSPVVDEESSDGFKPFSSRLWGPISLWPGFSADTDWKAETPPTRVELRPFLAGFCC